MLRQFTGSPLQYYDNTMDGFPPTSSNFDFVAHVLNAKNVKVSFDKIDGQDVIFNNGHNFNKFTIYEISDGVNSVLTRVEIKNETTVTLLSDISMIDIKSASLMIPKLGSPLNYDGVESAGYKCSFMRFPKSGISQKNNYSYVYTPESEIRYAYTYNKNATWFVLINDQFCCLLYETTSGGMGGFVIEVLRDHVICFDLGKNGVGNYQSIDNESFHTINRYSITGSNLTSLSTSAKKNSVLFPVVFDEKGADYISNYLFSSSSAPIVSGTHDYIYSDENTKFIEFYSHSRDYVFIVNIDGKR